MVTSLFNWLTIGESQSCPSPSQQQQQQQPQPQMQLSQPQPVESELGQVKKVDFECGVCFNLLSEPITIACGHTFCRTCLVTSLERRKKCPSCRSPCHITGELCNV